MQQIYVLTNFKLFIPVSGEDDNQFHVDQTSNPTLGVTLSKDNTNEAWQYQVELINCEGSKEIKINRALIWAKRLPYKLQTNANTKIIEGLVIQIKVNAGLFDFRSIKERLIRFEVKCFNGGRLLNQGTSGLVQLLAKKRYASEKESEVDDVPIIPVAWTSTPDLLINESNTTEPLQYEQLYAQRSFVSLDPHGDDSPSNQNLSTANERSPYSAEHIDSDDSMIVPMTTYHLNFLGSGSDSVGELEPPTNYEDNEQYMVLYNGNAEVIGNFRALNFYKASDINLKEQIRYISDNVDPREALLRIDGVEYKFKDGVKGNNNSKKRFVGYIAQQIEKVVPQAVQLINGILHVDYESLLPYLSESIKQNFKDINELKSSVSQVTQLMDMLYKEFTIKEQQQRYKQQSQSNSFSVKERKKPFVKRNKFRWLMIGGAILVLAVSVAVGAYFIWSSLQQQVNSPNEPQLNPISPIFTPEAPVPVEVPIPIQIPIAVPIADPGPPIDVIARERTILEEFYYATGGPNWITSGNWLTNVSVCSWQGVNCDSNNRVVSLQFTEPNNMTGTLPESLGELTMLTDLQFTQTEIGGTIPKIFRGLVHLKSFILRDNKFQGQFPTEVFNLTELEEVNIKGNFFDPWTLPAWINATNLANLYLFDCNLVGTVPPELGTITTLKTIRILHNMLEGTLPSFASASQLSIMVFYNTSLSGEIPEIPLSLKQLKLAYNYLTGGLDKLPSAWEGDSVELQFNNFSGKFVLPAPTLTVLFSLNIAYNNFTSAVDYTDPPSECNISGNSFACPLPQWLRLCTGAVCK